MENPFNNLSNPAYSQYIHVSRYARWLEEEQRRETWAETVNRYIQFFKARFPEVPEDLWSQAYKSIYGLETMPSMRALMTAGKALERDEVASYNCCFTAIDDIKCFDEIMYILMCGTGVGYSVERQYINKLPSIAEEMYETETPIIVRDSKIGWATSTRELISLLYAGKVPQWDLSRVRPAGARLKTFGGRASGPEPLNRLFEYIVRLFTKAKGRKLNSLECHDLVCMIADIVVVGGVRRSALISLSNLSDSRMRDAKSGRWYDEHPQRALANNSVAYSEMPDMSQFMDEWVALHKSKAGERGIFNKQAANLLMPQRRRDLNYPEDEWGCNPCSEILLRASGQMCNLSETIVRPENTIEKLIEKVRTSTFLGTLQSSLTNFRYLRRKWKNNCEEERLLGVSMTGIMDHPILSGSEDLPPVLESLQEEAIRANEECAEMLGINPSTAITCVKPSGTVSQLVDSSSGIHARFSPYYIRTVRNDKKDPVSDLLISEGVPHEPDNNNPESTWVFSFPIKSPEGSIVVDQKTAIEQLELWKTYQLHWCEHKPSVTIYVKEDEWMEVGAWVYRNFDIVSGISFLPYSDHIYPQAPYQPISKEAYEAMPKVDIDFTKLVEFEKEDNTTNTKELACTAGSCELI